MPQPAPDITAALSTAAQDYLKAIWSLAQESPTQMVGTKALADRLGVAASTASETIKRLTEQGYVDHARYGGVRLTARGEDIAVQMIRRHRIIETWLVEDLGYSWDQVVDEAEVLEHAVSVELIERLYAKLGRPQRDPHGDLIPTAAGELPDVEEVALSTLGAGVTAKIRRLSDRDANLLRFFDAAGLAPGVSVTVTDVQEAAGVMLIATTTDPTPIALGMPAAQAMWVSVHG